MKIIYNQNPLATQIFLDDSEKENLKLRIKIDELEDVLYDVYFRLKKKDDGYPKIYDPAEGFKRLEAWVKKEDREEGEPNLTRMLGYYIDALENESHAGDCTCFPCSCTKCHAEGKLGIDTIKGLHKHQAHKVYNAFNTDGVTTCDEAIAILQIPYSMDDAKTGTEDKSWWTTEYVDRWNKEREQAIEWLINYKQTYLDGGAA